MPSTSSRTTRSSAAIRFPSSKNAVATTPKSSSSSSKPDAITLLFRREVQSLLSTPPTLPSHIPANTPVEVVACVERLSLSGIQQSVQLCQAGEETWVTRTEGARTYFPRTGRVQKRLRGSEEEMEQGDEEQMDEEVVVESPTRKKKSKKTHSGRQELETPDNYRGRGSATSSSSTFNRNVLAAPEKKKKHRKSRQEASRDGNSDDGASTETEQSYLGRTRGGRSPAMLTSIGEDVAQMGRGQRRCTGRRTPQACTSEGEGLVKVKHEESDDLASLCGGVGGLEFRSTVDPGKLPVPLIFERSSRSFDVADAQDDSYRIGV
ncbi:hypothetical protein JCM5353_008969 [Sporobolomyces roseus]